MKSNDSADHNHDLDLDVVDLDVADLASLYALDALTHDECSWLEGAAAQQPELMNHIQDLQAVAAQLAYGAPIVPMSASLKDRLFQRIAVEPEMSPSLESLVEQAKTVQWEPYAPTPGTLLGKLLVDAEQGQIQCFVRSWGQNTFPQHRHAAHEEIVVLEGDLIIGDRAYQAGDRITSEAGTVHQPKTKTGCLLFLKASLDDELLG